MKDVKEYFGHEETDIIIEPYLTVLGFEFQTLMELQDQNQYQSKMVEVVKVLKKTEDLIIKLQGESSDKLAETMCTESFFLFQQQRF